MNSNSSLFNQATPPMEGIDIVVAVCVVAVVGGIMVILLLVFVVCFNKPAKKEDISALESFSEETEVLRENSVAVNDIAAPYEEVQLNTIDRKQRPQSSPSIFSREEFHKEEVLQLQTNEAGIVKDIDQINCTADHKEEIHDHLSHDVEIRITEVSRVTQEKDENPVCSNISALGLKIRKRKASMAALRESFNSNASNGDGESVNEAAECHVSKDEELPNDNLYEVNKDIDFESGLSSLVDCSNYQLTTTVAEDNSTQQIAHTSLGQFVNNNLHLLNLSTYSDEGIEHFHSNTSSDICQDITGLILEKVWQVISTKNYQPSSQNEDNILLHYGLPQTTSLTPQPRTSVLDRPMSSSNLSVSVHKNTTTTSTKLPSTPLSSHTTYYAVYDTNIELGGGEILATPEENVKHEDDAREVDVELFRISG